LGRRGWSAGAVGPLPPARIEALAVVGLLAVAAALRWVRWVRTDAMFNDGPLFLGLAAQMEHGRWAEALAHDYHPLYPFAVLVTKLALGPLGLEGWDTAAAVVSVAGGTAAVLFLYLLLREGFGWPAAWLGAGLLAVHYRAVEYTSDVQSEGLYFPLFLAGLWVGWRAWRRCSPALAAWTGALAGLAYLTRPEGLGVALVVGLVGGAEVLRGRWRLLPGAGWALALAGGALLLVLPYATVLRVETGTWSLSHKKSVAAMAGLGAAGGPGGEGARTRGEGRETAPTAGVGSPSPRPDPAPLELPGWELQETPGSGPVEADAEPSPEGRPLVALDELQSTFRSAARAETLVVLLLGLVVARGRPGSRGGFFLALVLLYSAVLLALTINAGYVSRRHIFPVIAALFGYAGLGIRAFGDLVAYALEGATRGRVALPARAALAIGVVAVVIPPLASQIEPRREEQLATRRAAEWLRTEVGRPGPIAARRRRVAYYAGAPHVPVRSTDPEELLPWLRASGARHLIIDAEELEPGDGERLEAAPDVVLLHRVVANGHEARVFALVDGTRQTGDGS